MLCEPRLYFPFNYKQMWMTIFIFIFFCAGGSRVYSVLYLNFSAEPKEYLVGPGNKGDTLKMTCNLLRHANESDLTIEIFQILNEKKNNYFRHDYKAIKDVTNIRNLKLDCFAEPPLCEGLDARFCYNKVYNKGDNKGENKGDNKGEIVITVIIAHLQCGHRGKWTCQVTPPSAHATAKAKTIQVVGFTRPSDVKITADGVSDTGFLIAMSGTTISFTCEGNVGSPDGHFYFATKQHLVTSELNEEDLYNATEETEAEDKECIWTRTGILEHQLSDVDDHKSFKCGVRCEKCEHEILFPHSIITVFIVNLNGTTWHSLNPLVTGGITDPLAPSNASSAAATLSECTNDVWVIFGVAAGGIIALVIIIESIFYLRKKIKSLSWYSF